MLREQPLPVEATGSLAAAPQFIKELQEQECVPSEGPSPFLDAPQVAECENEAQEELLSRINELASLASSRVRYDFLDALGQYRYGGGRRVSERIVRYLDEAGLLLPSFTFRFGKEGEAALEDLGLPIEYFYSKPSLPSDYGILIFNLPKPLSNSWWKTPKRTKQGFRKYGAVAGIDTTPLRSEVIEWGYFYDEIMDGFHSITDHFGRTNSLYLSRINPGGDHDADEFYYVWVVEPPRNTREN